jgi:hypothetical protein
MGSARLVSGISNSIESGASKIPYTGLIIDGDERFEESLTGRQRSELDCDGCPTADGMRGKHPAVRRWIDGCLRGPLLSFDELAVGVQPGRLPIRI